MSVERWFFGNVLYPAYHTVKRDPVLRNIAELDRNQWLSTTQLQELQLRKLERLLRHAASHVPYYRDLLSGASDFSPRTLRSLPPLTKAIVRRESKRLVAENAVPGELHKNSTSGSTGEPLYFYTDENSLSCRKAAVARNKSWAGLKRGDRELLLWGSPIDKARAARLRGRVHSWLTRSRLVSSYNLSQEELGKCLRIIASSRPRLITAYPSVLEELAREYRRGGYPPLGVPAFITSAETLYPHQRKLFEETFQAQIFNRYGSREVGDIAQECEQHTGLHINCDRVFVEVVREDLTACDPGEPGSVLVTDLDNFGMPLIRYAIGDRAALAAPGSTCACGRGLPRLEDVAGRAFDVIRFPNGSAVGGTYWTILLRTRPGIDRFQVVQQQLDEITIRYMADAPLPRETADFVRGEIAKRAGDAFRVKFDRVTEIAAGAGGKQRIVLSELKGP
jgi:phenylacetate-CoA ligase